MEYIIYKKNLSVSFVLLASTWVFWVKKTQDIAKPFLTSTVKREEEAGAPLANAKRRGEGARVSAND
jgi:hypothetical protein